MNEYKDNENVINLTDNENQEISSGSESSVSESSDDDHDKNYIISSKITDALLNKPYLPDITYNTCEAPKEHGLVNSNFIIPAYYQLHRHPSKIIKLDYYIIIQDDIRNCRILNEYQLKYIKDLPDEYKNELFDIFNECLKLLNELINDL